MGAAVETWIHPFPSPTPDACAYERGQPSARNALVFIGGLTSGPHATDLSVLAKMLESSALGYSLWEFRMRSSYSGFGYSSLANDAEDTAALVQYLRGIGKDKIVLIGASTGLSRGRQHKARQVPVDGYILTSPISDRESAFLFMSPEDLEKSVHVVKAMIDDGGQDVPMQKESLSPIFGLPVTAYRWHSLAAKGGDDDYFSSDFADSVLAEGFGGIDKPVLLLPAGDDEMMPPTVDRKALLERWAAACKGAFCRVSLQNGMPDSWKDLNKTSCTRKPVENFAWTITNFDKPADNNFYSRTRFRFMPELLRIWDGWMCLESGRFGASIIFSGNADVSLSLECTATSSISGPGAWKPGDIYEERHTNCRAADMTVKPTSLYAVHAND
ncbi:hypothetical protein C8A01DRAFT_41948 [Parachaetomium inaequale]|uniref:Alpha/beta hydrolase n=1 Tax=Parachaetomium inaequale TaxID=2588326 RepID=A0AAN6P8B7_9PEZI|nr:hypothetical protein C8A01DRAFT_41948 [Parachaetomium inaequale]